MRRPRDVGLVFILDRGREYVIPVFFSSNILIRYMVLVLDDQVEPFLLSNCAVAV